MKIITGHQPVYLPWLGLFHKIALADVFVFMDDVQYLKEDWNNRNRIKDSHGSIWLTVPVRLKDSKSHTLKDILIDWETHGSTKHHWQQKHWRSIQSCYGKAAYWDDYSPFFEELYLGKTWKWLSELNEHILRHLLDMLGIKTEFIVASEYGFEGYKSDLVLDHCLKLEADAVVLGTLGRDYVEEDGFLKKNISLYYQDYQHLRYPQRFGEFESHMSIIDLLFNCGSGSKRILLSGNVSKSQLLEALTSFDGAKVLDLAPDAEEVHGNG